MNGFYEVKLGPGGCLLKSVRWCETECRRELPLSSFSCQPITSLAAPNCPRTKLEVEAFVPHYRYFGLMRAAAAKSLRLHAVSDAKRCLTSRAHHFITIYHLPGSFHAGPNLSIGDRVRQPATLSLLPELSIQVNSLYHRQIFLGGELSWRQKQLSTRSGTEWPVHHPLLLCGLARAFFHGAIGMMLVSMEPFSDR